MIRYLITNRRLYPDPASQVRLAARQQSVDWVQIREKDLPARDLLDLTRRVIEAARPKGIEVLVNERADVALAAGADGIHLPSNSPPPSEYRKLGIRRIGVSCHNAAELDDAIREGADFAVLSPVFAPISKSTDLPPLGLDGFHALVSRYPGFPILALGGITVQNADACLQAGAAGVAGISLFSPTGPAASGPPNPTEVGS